MQFEQSIANLESQPSWSAKVAKDINPIPSTTYWSNLVANGVREFGHQAPAGGGFLSGLNDLPVPQGFTSGLVRHRLSLMFDASITDWTKGARIVAELDNRVSDGQGYNYNFSNQINLSNGGMWQVDPETGKWTDTGIKITALCPFIWHDFEFENQIDFQNKKLSFISLTIDGTKYLAPAQFHNLNAEKLNWGRGANLQVQMCRQIAGVSLMWGKRIGMGWQ